MGVVLRMGLICLAISIIVVLTALIVGQNMEAETVLDYYTLERVVGTGVYILEIRDSRRSLQQMAETRCFEPPRPWGDLFDNPNLQSYVSPIHYRRHVQPQEAVAALRC